MRGIVPALEALGARVAVVGNGSREQARAFREEVGRGLDLYVDPSLDAYRAAGLERSVAALIGLRAAKDAVRALRAGHRQTSIAGDALQLGGTFVVAKGGDVLFAHVAARPGDHADPKAVVAALAG